MVYERKSASKSRTNKKAIVTPSRTPKAQHNYLNAIVGSVPQQEASVVVSQVIRNAANEKRVEMPVPIPLVDPSFEAHNLLSTTEPLQSTLNTEHNSQSER
jgi:transcriptional antiterminator